MDQLIIEARGLTLFEGSSKTLNQFHFEGQTGQVSGLLGPAGSGASAFLEFVATRECRYQGHLFLFGADESRVGTKIQRKISWVTAEAVVDHTFSVQKNIRNYASYYGRSGSSLIKQMQTWLRQSGLEEFQHYPAGALSRLQQRKLSLIRSLVVEPELLLVDRPYRDLNATEAQEIFQFLLLAKQSGISLVVASECDWFSELYDQVHLLEKGQTLAEGTRSAIIDQHGSEKILVLEIGDRPTESVLRGIKDRFEYQIYRRELKIFVDKDECLPGLLHDFQGECLAVKDTDIDDVFVKIAGYSMEVR